MRREANEVVDEFARQLAELISTDGAALLRVHDGGLKADPATDPYASLTAIDINGIMQHVVEGTGAVRAYEAMMYGVERNIPGVKAAWRDLLLQYCELDTLSMILIFEHWRQAVAE